MDLDVLYGISHIDINQVDNNFACLFDSNLKYGSNEIKLQGIGSSIYTIEEYLRYKRNFPRYKQQVRNFIKWLKNTLSQCEPGNVWKNNIELYKQDSKGTWDNDEKLQQKFPDFEKFWKIDQNSYNDWAQEDCLQQWNMFQQEFEELNGDKLLQELGKEFPDHDFFTNYGQDLNSKYFDIALAETEKQIEDLLNLDNEKLEPDERAIEFFKQGIYKQPKNFKYYDIKDYEAIFKELFEGEYEDL